MAEAIQKFEDQTPTVAPMVAMIERIAMNPDLPIDRLEQMLAMKERMDAQAAAQAYAAAFARMQAALPVIPERGKIKNRNGEVQSTYPLWEDVNAALREPLADNGLSMRFDRRRDEAGKIFIGCIVTHKLGHSERAEIDLPRDTSGSKNEVQGEGSTVSYGQRYSSKLLINWISEGTEDDDGQRAGATTITEEQQAILVSLLTESGADEGKFLAYFKVGSLADLPAKAYGNADAMLRRKIAEAGK